MLFYLSIVVDIFLALSLILRVKLLLPEMTFPFKRLEIKSRTDIKTVILAQY
jgi:hypothetical protein